jgi:hypothetical protein
MKDTLQHHFEVGQALATNTLLTHGVVVPTFLVSAEDGRAAMIPGNGGRQATYDCVKLAVIALGAESVVMMSEGAMVPVAEDGGDDPPREDDLLCVILVTQDQTAAWSRQIRRDEKGRVRGLGEEKTRHGGPTLAGELSRLFPEAPPDKAARTAAEAMLVMMALPTRGNA